MKNSKIWNDYEKEMSDLHADLIYYTNEMNHAGNRDNITRYYGSAMGVLSAMQTIGLISWGEYGDTQKDLRRVRDANYRRVERDSLGEYTRQLELVEMYQDFDDGLADHIIQTYGNFAREYGGSEYMEGLMEGSLNGWMRAYRMVAWTNEGYEMYQALLDLDMHKIFRG